MTHFSLSGPCRSADPAAVPRVSQVFVASRPTWRTNTLFDHVRRNLRDAKGLQHSTPAGSRVALGHRPPRSCPSKKSPPAGTVTLAACASPARVQCAAVGMSTSVQRQRGQQQPLVPAGQRPQEGLAELRPKGRRSAPARFGRRRPGDDHKPCARQLRHLAGAGGRGPATANARKRRRRRRRRRKVQQGACGPILIRDERREELRQHVSSDVGRILMSSFANGPSFLGFVTASAAKDAARGAPCGAARRRPLAHGSARMPLAARRSKRFIVSRGWLVPGVPRARWPACPLDHPLSRRVAAVATTPLPARRGNRTVVRGPKWCLSHVRDVILVCSYHGAASGT